MIKSAASVIKCHYFSGLKILNSNPDQIFINSRNQHPKLRERMNALLNMFETAANNCAKAGVAEQPIIDELHKMGNEALHSWADNAVRKITEALRNQELQLHGNSK